MSGYSKMDLMRMSDEELKTVLKEEGDTLPGYLIAMIIDELEVRKNLEETPADDDGSSGEGDPGVGDVFDEAEDDFSEGENGSEDAGAEDEAPMGSAHGEEDAESGGRDDGGAEDDAPNEEDLTPEERLERDIAEAEKIKKERTRILIIAAAAAGLTILALTVTLIILYFTGQLKL